MRTSKAKNLSTLFRSAVKSKTSKSNSSPLTSIAKGKKHFVSSLYPPSRTISISKAIAKRSFKLPSTEHSSPNPEDDFTLSTLKFEAATDPEHSTNQLTKQISSILCGGESIGIPEPQEVDDVNTLEKVFDIPCFATVSHGNISLRWKETGSRCYYSGVGKLGRETSVKEYNALIRICIDTARTTNDDEVALEQVGKAFHLFKSLREQGFQLEEETYRPLLLYLIDMGMVEEFHFFCGVINEENPNSVSRLAYYEMMLWLEVNNEEKIRGLCEYIAVSDEKDNSNLLDHAEEGITNFIASYAVSIPNLAVEDVISKFWKLHSKLDVPASSSSYEKLILYCCDSLKLHMVLDIVDEMCQAGLTLSIEVLNSILRVTEETYEFNLVHRIYSMICRHNLKSNNETFRSMIYLHVRMKDFVGAYNMLDDLEKMSSIPTASLYNTIMAGYFRERNISSGLMVLKQMERADVKPDSQTFSCLISNCENEEGIIKYYEEMKKSGVQATKQIFMALINAYANSGQYEKAKQIASDKAIPVKSLNEIKSVLVLALASHGQMVEALFIYDEIKEAGYNLEPRAVISLIEHTQLDGKVDKLLQMLKELNGDYWVDGCCRIILYCVRFKHLSSAVDLLKQLKDKFYSDELVMEVLFDEVFSLIAQSEHTHLQIGLYLLRVIKDELGLFPSRKCLDFLLLVLVPEICIVLV
ncbi:Pentatricopeptide repeat-containing protein [Quillaja saponaria]|uniref:Pentatricopeptide repeat-containing protein n=1 Tax=Quillaja saponaria TaxID=32244 RepID=A0AAD7QHR9_QUISA|nr:Pentatricopeptide repeat-containing protein [Quillaja saponaria]